MKNNYKDILDIGTSVKSLKTPQDFSNLENTELYFHISFFYSQYN